MHDLWCWELVAKAFKQYDYVNRYIDVAVMHEKSWTIQTISGLVLFWNMRILKLKSQNAFTLLSPVNHFRNMNRLADLNIFGLSKFNFQRLDNSFWNSDAIPNLMRGHVLISSIDFDASARASELGESFRVISSDKRISQRVSAIKNGRCKSYHRNAF